MLYERFAIRRVLVIAPKTVADATWSAEAGKWEHTKHLRVSVVLGPLAKREKALEADADIYVINRENVSWLIENHDFQFDMVVIDEASSFKNPSSKRFKYLRSVLPRVKRIVALTGTPAPNGMADLWAQIYLLDRGKRLGRTVTAFRDIYFNMDYCRPGQMYRTYSLRPGADKQILERISDICISMKAEDYLSLPDFVEHDVPVVLDSHAQDAYDTLQKEFVLEVGNEDITATSAAVLNSKLLQLCSGAVYNSDGTVSTIHSAKLDAFEELLDTIGDEHVLVFYWYQHERDALLKYLAGTKKRYEVYRDATTAEAWNYGRIDVLLAHPASCGYGLNLQHGGRHVVWYGFPNWNLELYQQANKRLHRQGQDRPVVCHHLTVVGGMDEALLKALHGKGDAQEAVLSALKAKIEEVKRNDI